MVPYFEKSLRPCAVMNDFGNRKLDFLMKMNSQSITVQLLHKHFGVE